MVVEKWGVCMTLKTVYLIYWALLFAFIIIAYIITFSIYSRYKIFLSFGATICFTNPDYRLIWTPHPKLLRIGEGFVQSTGIDIP
jgi:hypothetical protein